MMDSKHLDEILADCQTPFYLFDEQAVAERIERMKDVLPAEAKVCYAMKANPFILRAASQAANLVEVCSPGELAICRAVGVPDEKLVISGVYKERAVMSELIGSQAAVHRYTIESIAQYELISSLAREKGTAVRVLLRLTNGNQFGMDAADLKRIVRDNRANRFVEFCGVQYFSGTQKSSFKKVQRELDMLDGFLEELGAEFGACLPELEYGPGFPIDYCEDDQAAAASADDDFLGQLAQALAGMRFKGTKVLEIGRGIAARCGAYATRVVDAKRNQGHNYAIVDGGKHQLVYYGQSLAFKSPVCRAVPERRTGKLESWAVCGALCTTNDLLVKQMEVEGLCVGDCLVFPNAGAYCMTEGLALFLSRDLPRVYLRDASGAVRLVRDRVETSVLNTPQA